MTTKGKIVFGFVTMMAIVAAISALAYVSLEQSSRRFATYRTYAAVNVLTNEIMANLGAAGTQSNSFLLTRDEKDLESCMRYMDALDANFAESLQIASHGESLDTLTKLREMSVRYRADLSQLAGAINNMQQQYVDTVVPNQQAVSALLHTLAGSARRESDIAVIAGVEELWSQYAMMLASLGRYAYSRSNEDVRDVEKRIDVVRPLLERVRQSLRSDYAKYVFAGLSTAAENIFSAIGEMKRNGNAANQLIQSLVSQQGEFTLAMGEFNNKIDIERRSLGDFAIEANGDAQKFLLAGSGFAIVIGFAIAIVIITGIIRVLKDLSSFAAAVAAGDFGYRVKTREKGEIGGTVEAMKQIPLVLQKLISDIAAGVALLRVGRFRSRLDAEEYAGAYGDLVSSVNTVSEAYTSLLDELPIPILSADASLAVHFANAAGRDALNGKLVETFSGAGGKEGASFGKKALESGKNYAGETVVGKGGRDIHMAVTAVPLKDESGEAVAFIEILTDLTEIRTQQQVMLQVANEALEIASRVAAASEQLAAQIEQVSHGAEVQRERVEGTASAMTEMNATVLEVARSAGEASKQSEDTRMKAQNGAELVNKVMAAISRVNAVARKLQNNMQELGKQAESIGNVMNVISDIADQTNLLALNAAIEAARAGDAGRGFAVVADEVRKLAEKTMQATHEVGSSINAVQQSARTNVEEVNNAVSAISEANGLADSSGASLSEIVKLASASSSVVASIATAAEQQGATSEEISRAIDEINLVVSDTTEGMVQSATAIQDLSRMAQELRRVMEGLR